MKLNASDLRNLNIFKHYRLVRKWACNEGWIDVWRHRNRTTIKYSIFQTSFKCKRMITRIYNILLGYEDIPTSEQNVFYKNKTYTDKVFNKAIEDMLKDSNR